MLQKSHDTTKLTAVLSNFQPQIRVTELNLGRGGHATIGRVFRIGRTRSQAGDLVAVPTDAWWDCDNGYGAVSKRAALRFV